MMQPTIRQADITAFSVDKQPVLIAEVKTHIQWEPEILKQLQDFAAQIGADYLLTVDLEKIKLFRLEDGSLGTPLLEVPTRSVLEHYAPDMDWAHVRAQYLELLVETWLRDIALSVQPEPAPELERLQEIGLAQRLAQGEVALEWRGFF